jgi:hypothetical protein
MASRFPGSAVLEQSSVGHCSISSPSVFTANVVREYFQHLRLPKEGTICGVDRNPFEETSMASIMWLEGEDAKLWDVVKIFGSKSSLAKYLSI